jgi:purine-binding chemotaxis protein CheW
VERADGGEVIRDERGVATLRSFSDVLGVPATEAESERATQSGEPHALIIEGPDGRVALQVERLCGREDLVVRAFGPSLGDVDAVVGAAEVAGDLALVVDAEVCVEGPRDAGEAADVHAGARAGSARQAKSPGVASGSTPAPSGPALVVEVAGAQYALALAPVREVVASVSATWVPRAPAGVVGVMARHGGIHTVIDLAWLVGVAASTPAAASPIVLVDVGAEVVGLRVERVHRVVRSFAEAPVPIAIDAVRLFAERFGSAR